MFSKLQVELLSNGIDRKLLINLHYNNLIVPKEFISNGLSIPRLFWSIVGSPWCGKYVKSAILHDYLYDKTCVYNFTRKESDKIFYKSLITDGVSKKKSLLLYYIVRLFGKKYFNTIYKGVKYEY